MNVISSLHCHIEEYFADIATAYQAEIQDLYAAGCRNIQIDDPLLAYFCAESMIKGMEERGVDHEALLDTYIRAYNNCLKNRPADMNVGLHLCRGNFRVCTALAPLFSHIQSKMRLTAFGRG